MAIIPFLLISSAQAQTGAAAQPPGIVEMLVPFALMFVVFYFLLIRPQNKARKQHAEMIANVKRGDTVVTAGGLVGKVAKATQPEETEVVVRIAEGVEVSVVKATLTDVRGRTQPSKTEDKK